MLAMLGVGEWSWPMMKLVRAYGQQIILVQHRFADLRAVGADGSREIRLAERPLADAETNVTYAQPPDHRASLEIGSSEIDSLECLLRCDVPDFAFRRVQEARPAATRRRTGPRLTPYPLRHLRGTPLQSGYRADGCVSGAHPRPRLIPLEERFPSAPVAVRTRRVYEARASRVRSVMTAVAKGAAA